MTTTLNCLGWMQNQNDQSPCLTAQEVGQLCNAGYTVPLSNFQEIKYLPNATTANGCTCAWSIYNLLSACSFCVGQYQYTSWSTWITNCGSYTSNTSWGDLEYHVIQSLMTGTFRYLPSGLSISQGIPFWAATNPSTWENAIFNITQAADIAAAAHPDVTGGPLPTFTTTASSTSGGSVGAIIGGVIGGIAVVIIGGLIIFWAACHHRCQRMHTTPIGAPYFNPSQPVTMPVPSNQNRSMVQPSPFSLAAMSSLASPVSSSFTSHGHGAALPLTDAADMISPFLSMSPAHQTNQSNTSPLTDKAALALSEHVMTPPGQRARLNPPPYSASVEPGPSAAANTWAQRASMKKQKKRNGSVLVATTSSGHLRTQDVNGGDSEHD